MLDNKFNSLEAINPNNNNTYIVSWGASPSLSSSSSVVTRRGQPLGFIFETIFIAIN